MDKDFLQELGYIGFATRLKRISDALMHEGRKLYNNLDVDIEPNWYVVFKLLDSRGGLTVTEIAESVQMAHPSIIAITNKMLAKGYLISEKDANDSRKRILDLSEYAVKRLPEFEKIWQAGVVGMENAIGQLDALDFLSKLEVVFNEKGFESRTRTELKT